MSGKVNCHSKTPLMLDRRQARGWWLLVGLVALAGGAKAILFDRLDPDLFWHLRVGEILLRDGVGPMVDTFSYNSKSEPWTPYSWLAEIAMAVLWRGGGVGLAVGLQSAMTAGLIVLIALACREAVRSVSPLAGGHTLGGAVAVFAAAFLALPYLSYRPVHFALLAMAVCVWLLWRDRRLGGSGAVWWVVPVAAVTVNVHLYAVLLLGIVGAWTLETQTRRSLGVCVATGLALLCTPVLPGVIDAAVHYQQKDPMVASGLIREMKPFWTGPFGAISGLLAAGMVGAILARRHLMGLTDWLWLAIGVILLLRLGRFSPVFAILVAPMLARTLSALPGLTLQKPAVQIVLALVCIFGGIGLVARLPLHGQVDVFLNRLEEGGYPANAVERLGALRLEHATDRRDRPLRLINDFSWGGYLGWKLGDEWAVLLDGRTQLYPDMLWREAYLDGDAARRSLLERANAHAAILPKDDLRFTPLLLEQGWSVVYEDSLARLLLPPKDD